MNILIVQESNWITRNPHQQHHLMEHLALRGHSIRVIDYDIDWKKKKESGLIIPRRVFPDVHKIFPNVSIKVIRPQSVRLSVFEYPNLLISHNKEISRQIREFKPDIIIGFGILNAWLSVRLAYKHGIPFIYYWIDALETLIPEKIFQGLGKKLEKKTIRNSTKVIAINEKLRDYAITIGAEPLKTIIIGAGIDLVRFNSMIDGSQIRNKYGIKPDEVILFFMGWLYHFSGLKELALELANLRDVYRNLKLLIVGDGDAYNDLKRIQDEHNLETKMILAGKQPYDIIPELIAASNICILPANPNEQIMQDIVPIKMYEYMAMGKPVITTRLPGIMKEFGDNNGILYADNQEKVLEMANFIIDQDLVEYYGNSAKKFVQNLDWEKITDSFENIIIGIIND